MKQLLLLALLTLVGCASRGEYDFALVGPAEDLAQAQVAADMWNGCQSVHVTVSYGAQPGKQTITFQEGDTVKGQAEGTRGYTDERGNITYVHVDTPVTTILAHEFGHALGLDHRKDGIMRPTLRGGETVTGNDCAALDGR